MIQPRKAVERLKKYRPPLEGRGGKMRLDFNENTVGGAPEVIRALRKALNGDWLSRYPEYEESRKALAKYFGVAFEEILLANGTDDAVKMICDSFVDPDDVLVVPTPTFPIYQFFHEVAGGQVVRVPREEDFSVSVEKLLAAGKKARWIALANPNNPTGTQIPQSDLRAILRGAPDTLVLVDEAYFDFSGETVLPWIRKFSNLVVARTFSKAFGLAGLRIGCLFATSDVAGALHRAQNPFAVNSLALEGARVAIKHQDYVDDYVNTVRENRAAICRWLDAKGIAYVPSAANFVLVRIGERATEIAGKLRDEGILVRDWNYDPHLKGYLRFTVGSRVQMRRLMKELERVESMMETRSGARSPHNTAVYSSTGWFA